jgi:glutathione synthase/RimK-type ligase-like ATP-grasp enzyme
VILVITSKRDAHIELVTPHLDNAGAPWVRINTEDLATNIELTITPTECDGTLYVRDSEKTVPLKSVHAVWYRKPDPPNTAHFDLEGPALDYVEAELNEVLHGLYALLRDRFWINDPFRTRIAHRKMLQLNIAGAVGFHTPRTIITNQPEAALAFARDTRTGVAIKSLGAISVVQRQNKDAIQYGIFTRRISFAELAAVKDKIQFMPTLFQEFVPKAYELRITAIGSHIFACRIDHREEDITQHDYRFDTNNLPHRAWECSELHDKLQAYLETLGINFGCFDVVVTPTDEAVFLECNPNGQWAWVEKMTGLPIGAALARALIGERG